MHLHFEKNSNTKCDCTILSLSWMGKVPEEELPEDEGWKLNRTNYYQEGWLATGNTRGIVGVTFSTSHCKKSLEFPQRTNYNLRGHRSDVILTKWNEPYQKLASCDSSGIIFVWIKYEGRWSVELINDRNTPVTHFSWSHDGRMALITYQDGFVLVGSVAGQRYWSSMLNLEATITCGIWTPDDQQVYFGTSSGEIIVMNVHGAMVSQVSLSNYGITSMSWSCEKFKMEEGDTEPGVKNAATRTFMLAVSFKNGLIYLLKSFDDLSPFLINTELSEGFCMEWSNSRELLAVAGTEKDGKCTKKDTKLVYNNTLKFYTETGQLLYMVKIPNTASHVTALTWGHNDKRIFIATGNQIHIAWVSRRIASLQLMCRLKIQQNLMSESQLARLPLPGKLKTNIGNLFAQTIRCGVPDMKHLRDFVSRPPENGRLHCTIIRHDEDANQSSGTCYTLYLEFMGGLIPILKGKRMSKIRPEFVIFDPQDESSSSTPYSSYSSDTNKSFSSYSTSGGKNADSDSSESGAEDLGRSSKNPRKKRTKQRKQMLMQTTTPDGNLSGSEINENHATDELTYIDTLPEHLKLVEVTSNIWGTKFKIHGLAKSIIPANLGMVTYKTSLLHLQPRQMTLVITELRDDFPILPDPLFNPNIFSEDEDEFNVKSLRNKHKSREPTPHCSTSGHPPIAPMTPRPKNRYASPHHTPQRSSLSYASNSHLNNSNSSASTSSSSSTNLPSTSKTPKSPPRSLGPLLAKQESYDDDLLFETPVLPAKNILNYASIMSSYGHGRSLASSSNNQSRVAISPLYCEQSLPTLQSPKNAVAPSDVAFERPHAGQTTLMNYSSSNSDYLNNLTHVKNALSSEHARQNSHVNPVPINLNLNVEKTNNEGKSLHHLFSKKKSIEYIDDEPTPTTSTQPESSGLNRTQTVISFSTLLPDVMTRSCSVGYLDSVELVPGDVTLSQLRNEAQKRLVLVDRKIQSNRKQQRRISNNQHRRSSIQSNDRYKTFKKSISLDSYDIFQNIPNLNKDLNNLFNQMPKLTESSENNTEDTENSSTELTISAVKKPKKTPKERIYGLFSPRGTPILGRKFNNSSPTPSSNSKHSKIEGSPAENPQSIENKKKSLLSKWRKYHNNDQTESQGECSKNIRERRKNKNLEIITSFTDSPLFSRKYRSSKNEIPCNTAARPQLQSEQNTPIMSRRNGARNDIEVTQLDSKASVSLHTQAMTTLENIISRLRDLDDEKVAGTSSRNIRSSPSSPATTNKNKRSQHMSPIRNILNSPLLNRRKNKKQQIDTSDEDCNDDDHPATNGSKSSYHDLETFQKAQLRQKLKRGKIEPNGTPTIPSCVPVRREFVMYNKAPMWNENSQVYQLDFGGRVTQESAKNFQIEFRGKQVMQFGRISLNAYTLDFEYPFSALQAFSVALANVTQRLK